jgi:hypothetical protein
VTPCHLHALIPAIGSCSRCRKAFCDRCMPVRGAQPLCRSCMTKGAVAGRPAPTANAGPRPVAGFPAGPLLNVATPPPAVAPPGAQRIHLSWLVLAVGGLLGFLMTGEVLARSRSAGEAAQVLLAGPLGMAYAGWALFWGAPASWRWCWKHRSIFEGLREIKYFGPLYYLACSLAWALWGAVVLSILGGGIYHFARYRRSLP